jgi:TolB protein
MVFFLVFNGQDSDTAPAFSPGASKIAFASDQDGDYDIYTTTSDGSHIQPFSNNRMTNASPHCCFDEGWVVCLSLVNSSADLFIASADGGPPQRTAFTTRLCAFRYAWSY